MNSLEFLYAKTMQWLWLNTKLNWGCELCRSGRRVKRLGFLHWVHPNKNGSTARCREPSWWIHLEKKKQNARTNRTNS